MTQSFLGCSKIKCQDKVDCSRREVVIFVDPGKADNWYAVTQHSNRLWASKDGDDRAMVDIEGAAERYYRDVYKPEGKLRKTCWDCSAPRW